MASYVFEFKNERDYGTGEFISRIKTRKTTLFSDALILENLDDVDHTLAEFKASGQNVALRRLITFPVY